MDEKKEINIKILLSEILKIISCETEEELKNILITEINNFVELPVYLSIFEHSFITLFVNEGIQKLEKKYGLTWFEDILKPKFQILKEILSLNLAKN